MLKRILVTSAFCALWFALPSLKAADTLPARYTDAEFWRMVTDFSEPGGAFLRSNDPAADRWFSRDVAAISASRGLSMVAPYFIDAEREPGGSRLPIGGLTVIAFPNNHLLYALTWGTLALMAAAGTIFVNLDLLRSRSEPREAELHDR